MKKVLFIVNHDIVIYNFRKELVQKLIEENYEVYIVSPMGERIPFLVDMGAKYIDIQMQRRGTNPFSDIKLLKAYKKIIKQVKPNVVLTYTIKPNIYGGLAAKALNVPYIANITGLGTAVENKGMLQKITIGLYKKAFKKVDTVFFQNQENMNFFIKNKISNTDKYMLLPGSGVNLEHFKPLEYKENNELVITYLGRMMESKGTEELLYAIRSLNNSNILFKIVGSYEDEKYKLLVQELEKLGLLEYIETVTDIIPILKASNAIIQPSYHEGMSNVLLEAAASARPVLASNVPGCKETFDDDITGLSFEVKNVESIIETIQKFSSLTFEQRRTMGLKGRKKMEQFFDRNIVVNAYLTKINNILN